MATFEDRESLSSVRSKINDAIVAIEGTTSFSRVAVAGQGNVDADGKNSTLNLEAGSNITITTNAGTDTVTISSTASGGGVVDGDKGDITVSGGGTVWTIDNGAVDLATKVSGTLPAASFNDTAHGSRAGGTLHADATTSVSGFMSGTDKTKLNGIATGANLYVHPNHTGDVTSVADGATTIAANAVTNAKLAQAVANTLKGNNTGATANVADLTTSQVKTMLAITTADISGLGTLATQSGTFSGTSSGTNTGDQLIFQTIAVSGQSNVVADTTADTLTLVAGTGTSITTNAATDTITFTNTAPDQVVALTQGGTVTVSGTYPNFTISGAATNLGYTASTRALTSSTGTGVTLPLFSSTDAGLTPASGGGTTNFLRADGTWAAPAGGGGGVTTFSAGTTGLTPSTATSGAVTLAGTLGVSNGGTGATTLTGYVKGNGTSAMTASATIPSTDISGLGTLATQSGTFSGTSSGTNTGDQLIFQNIAVSGQTTVVADTTADTLTLVAGTGTSITTNATTDTITFTNTAPDQTVSLTQAGTVTITGTYPSFTINGAATDLSYTASTRLLASSTGTDVTLPLFTSTDGGLVPASGGGTTNFLRADGTWGAVSASQNFVLLGTLTTTSGTTQTLSSLDLTTYQTLLITVDNISHNSATTQALQLGASGSLQNANVAGSAFSSGFVYFFANQGLAIGNITATSGASTSRAGSTGYTTATTSISFSWTAGAAFDSGIIRVYGVSV